MPKNESDRPPKKHISQSKIVFEPKSCECERSFSALRRLKEYTRSTMTNDRLNGLALMYIHQDIVPDTENVIDRFALNNRRLDFT